MRICFSLTRLLAGKGFVLIKNLRYAFLKRSENLTDGKRHDGRGVVISGPFLQAE